MTKEWLLKLHEYVFRRANCACECCGREYKGDDKLKHLSISKLMDRLNEASLILLCPVCTEHFNIFRRKLWRALQSTKN